MLYGCEGNLAAVSITSWVTMVDSVPLLLHSSMHILPKGQRGQPAPKDRRINIQSRYRVVYLPSKTSKQALHVAISVLQERKGEYNSFHGEDGAERASNRRNKILA